MAVPAAATPIPPTENTVSYGLGDLVGSLRLVRLDKIDTGTVASTARRPRRVSRPSS